MSGHKHVELWTPCGELSFNPRTPLTCPKVLGSLSEDGDGGRYTGKRRRRNCPQWRVTVREAGISRVL